MKSILSAAAFAGLVGLAACAQAAPPDQAAYPQGASAPCQQGGGGMGMRGMGHGRMGGMGMAWRFTDPQQVAGLKSQLAIRPEQDAAWDSYAKTLQDTAATWQTDRQTDMQAVQAMTPDERRNYMTEQHNRHWEARQALSNAATTLMASLDDTQKAKAEGALPGLYGGHGHGGMMGRGRGW
jgi:hypothetical protein